jgi:hypothetical protein
MEKILMFTVVLALLTVGCVAHRIVEVDIARIEIDSTNSNDRTLMLAVDSFHDVANQLGFVVKGPIQDPRSSGESFSASAPGEKISLDMMVDNKQINFISGVVGTKEDFIAAQKASTLFEQALDKRGVQYKAVTRKDLLGP